MPQEKNTKKFGKLFLDFTKIIVGIAIVTPLVKNGKTETASFILVLLLQ